jgi:hypothetical protein
LHRGDFKNRGNETAEAVGARLEFQSGDFPRVIATTPQQVTQSSAWHEVEQGVPDA